MLNLNEVKLNQKFAGRRRSVSSPDVSTDAPLTRTATNTNNSTGMAVTYIAGEYTPQTWAGTLAELSTAVVAANGIIIGGDSVPLEVGEYYGRYAKNPTITLLSGVSDTESATNWTLTMIEFIVEGSFNDNGDKEPFARPLTFQHKTNPTDFGDAENEAEAEILVVMHVNEKTGKANKRSSTIIG